MVVLRREADKLLTAPGGMFEIVQANIGGRTISTWKSGAATAVEVLAASRNHGDRPFIVYESTRLSFADHYRQSIQLAHTLIDRFGVRKGDRVAIAMRNVPEWSVAFWAILACGGVAVLLNAWWTSNELRYGLLDADVRLVLVDSERLERLAPFREELGDRQVVTVRTDVTPSWAHRLEDLLAASSGKEQPPEIDLSPDDAATIIYTSGSTGFPKGAYGTHRNFTQFIPTSTYVPVRKMIEAGVQPDQLGAMLESAPPSVALLTLPLFHVSGCHAVLQMSLFYGNKVVMTRKWDPEEAAQLIATEGVTTFVGVPTMSLQLLDAAERIGGLPSLTTIGIGGAATAPELLRRLKRTFPNADVSSGYGLTECSSTVCAISGDEYLARPDSVGTPPPVVEIMCADDDGNDVPTGDLGELWVRGPGVVMGYWNKPDETHQAFVDGWFKTGDIGRLDDEGYVYVVDRKKDMIIRGGENIFCVEVEAALMSHPSTKAACVFGAPHPVLGEEVAAVVHVADPAVTTDDLAAHLRGQVAAYKIPSRMWLQREPLPVGPTGKVAKLDLKRAMLGA